MFMHRAIIAVQSCLYIIKCKGKNDYRVSLYLDRMKSKSSHCHLKGRVHFEF